MILLIRYDNNIYIRIILRRRGATVGGELCATVVRLPGAADLWRTLAAVRVRLIVVWYRLMRQRHDNNVVTAADPTASRPRRVLGRRKPVDTAPWRAWDDINMEKKIN